MPPTATHAAAPHGCSWVYAMCMPAPITYATLQRLLATPTDKCQPWPHSLTSRGYPQMTHPSGERYAHRAALLETVGPAPDGLEAAHTCGRRDCINPKHLRWTTASENNQDKRSHGTQPRGDSHHWAVAPDSIAEQAIARYLSGESPAAIAADIGVSRHTVRRWGQGTSRRHLTESA